MSRAPIQVYSFGPAWGIPVPTCSPFGLKLVTWLRMVDLPSTMHVENNPAKGPKNKCPWIVVDGQTIGDSELIMSRLRAEATVDLNAGLSAEQKAIALCVRRMLDEHYHQVWEHQLFIDDGGWEQGKIFFNQIPAPANILVRTLVRRDLRKQLYARGVGRHSNAEIIQMGIDDLDAVDALLGDRDFLFGDAPSEIDATVFAFLSLTYYVPCPSPLWTHMRSLTRLTAYCDRMLDRYFKDQSAA
ncbi:MAG: glutathione S-transferase family protein [Myxococcales bacterium]|nr:glutathione S-transferase family protein [Myxococcales bacterium]